MLAVFYICLAVIAYVYAGYPVLLRLGVLGARRDWKRGIGKPPLATIIVPAHNEEAAIGIKIENLLSSDYPRESMDILIGSDGSSDGTEGIVRRYAGEGVGLVSFPQQHGKSAIQNGLVSLASGEILLFTDADCTFEPQTLRVLIDNFADPAVGLVTGRPAFENRYETSVTRNEGIYLRYETWLRREERARAACSHWPRVLFLRCDANYGNGSTCRWATTSHFPCALRSRAFKIFFRNGRSP